MTPEQQAIELLHVAKTLVEKLDAKEGEILKDTFGVSQNITIHVEGPLFVELTKLTRHMTDPKPVIETQYEQAHFHGKLRLGYTDFVVCQSLLP